MNVSSVKNLNGETFSAVQDADLTTVVQSNSGNWNDISAYQTKSATYMPSGQFISARNLDQIIRGRSTSSHYIGFKIPDSTIDTPAVYLRGQFGSAYYKENELKLGRSNMTIAFNIGGAGPKISAGGTGTMAPSYMYLYNSANTASLSQTGLLLSANDTTSGLVNIPSISAWNDTTDVVQTNSATWGAGSTPTYDYTDNNLISAIDTSGLYATSAYVATYAQSVVTSGKLGHEVYYTSGYPSQIYHKMVLNPQKTPFWNTSGIYGPLYYAQGACMTYGSSAQGSQFFGGFIKGNEWYVSNATAGQALRGEAHASRGVHLSGATTAGNSFDLSTSAVSGKNDTANGYNWKLERSCVSGKGINGEWRYGPAEDTALRTASALPQINFVSTSSEATGTNILYVVTGAGA